MPLLPLAVLQEVRRLIREIEAGEDICKRHLLAKHNTAECAYECLTARIDFYWAAYERYNQIFDIQPPAIEGEEWESYPSQYRAEQHKHYLEPSNRCIAYDRSHLPSAMLLAVICEQICEGQRTSHSRGSKQSPGLTGFRHSRHVGDWQSCQVGKVCLWAQLLGGNLWLHA